MVPAGATGYAGRMSEPRTTAERRADVIEIFARQGHAWLATADDAGDPRLIVVSCAWDGETLLLATRGGSPTARNLDRAGRARLGFGEADDVVMVDVDVSGSKAATPSGGDLTDRFVAALGWDPADEGDDWRYFVLRPVRIEAYRGYGELAGRFVMRDGAWLA